MHQKDVNKLAPEQKVKRMESEFIIVVHLFLHLKKFLSDRHQRFRNDREAKMSVTEWFQSQAADFYDTGYKSWPYGLTNVSIPEVNMLKNSSIFAVCFHIIISIEFSVQEQVLHCKHRNLGCSSDEGTLGLSLQTQEPKLQFYKGLNRCGEMMRVDLANWALRSSPKFITGVKYLFN